MAPGRDAAIGIMEFRAIMPLYEHVYMARQDLAPNQVEAMTEAVGQIVSEHKGEVKGSEYWGLRNLAYRINKGRKAHYVLVNIEAPASAIQEIERQASLSEDIVRFLTVRVDEFPEGPSAILRKEKSRRGRDEGGW